MQGRPRRTVWKRVAYRRHRLSYYYNSIRMDVIYGVIRRVWLALLFEKTGAIFASQACYTKSLIV
jgi:hypothetical protein